MKPRKKKEPEIKLNNDIFDITEDHKEWQQTISRMYLKRIDEDTISWTFNKVEE